MSKKILIAIGCALLLALIVCGVRSVLLAEQVIEIEVPEPLQLDIPLDDGSGHETVIYGIDSEVE